MKMQIIVKIEQEDGSALTESTAVEVNIPEIEAFDSPEVFDEVFDGCERGVLEARNGVVEEAMGKYLSVVAKKNAVGAGSARRRTDRKAKRLHDRCRGRETRS